MRQDSEGQATGEKGLDAGQMPKHHPVERDGDVIAAVIGGEVPCPAIEFRPHHGLSVTHTG